MGLTSAFSKPGGGGRLNNVDGLIVDYQFSTDFPYQAKNPSKTKRTSKFNTLWFNLEVKADGAEESSIEPLFAGSADDWTISEDGHVLTPNPEAEKTPRLFGNAPRFLQSCIEHGFEEPEYEEGDDIDLTSIINNRARFVQVVDEEANRKRGKQVDKKDPKKTYDRKTLEVSNFYGPAEEDEKPSKGKGKAAVKPTAKGKKAAEEDEETDHSEVATAVVQAVVKKEGSISVKKIGTPALRVMLAMKTPQGDRDAILELIKSKDFLETEDGWSFNAKSGEIEEA